VVTRAERAWAVLDGVPDPEVPALSVRDLGIVRDVIDHGAELEVVLTPTYSGCPATEVIEQNVLSAIEAEGLGPARTTLRRAPAWTTDWISEEGKRKLREYGIAPPGSVILAQAGTQSVRFFRRQPERIACPHCGSTHTEQTSAFGSTACKSLHRCLACREPFEYFKPL
jgi:ring-1,2-phenylacetyl-CoA epoxidase subunit PaaD